MAEVGVIIPSFRDRAFLERCLDALWLNTDESHFTLCVVNDSPDDIEHSMWLHEISQGKFYVLPTPTIRFTRACNEGLRWMRAHQDPNWYMLLNSDTEVTPFWLERMLGTARRTGASIVGAKLLLGDGLIHHAGAFGVGYHYGDHQPNSRFNNERIVPWVTGALMMISKECYFACGDLPEGETQYDESDRNYQRRAWRAGFSIAYSSATVYHYTDASRLMRGRDG